MIYCYGIKNGKLTCDHNQPDLSDKPIWIDMLSPSIEEEKSVEASLGIDAPTPEEMKEIEVSSRLYSADDALYIITTLVTQAESEEPQTHSVTFIIKDNILVTLRYSEPKAFNLFLNRIEHNAPEKYKDGLHIFLGIMEAVIDRLSDTLELIGRELDKTSSDVFQQREGHKTKDLQNILKEIGKYGDLNGKVRESLLSLTRVFGFLRLARDADYKEHDQMIETLAKDVISLTEHAAYVSGRVTLLLDATLGLINIEQNAIIKIFSVAAVVFLPPTLIASIYGMNFEFMPELSWPWGYPMALVMMVFSAILPYLFFKRRGWL
jgi:magnesium transporter